MALRSRRFVTNERLQAAARNQPPLAIGSTNAAVRIMQQAFVDLGFPMPITTKRGTSDPDGIFGSETRAVVTDFQKQQTLSPDGVAGNNTLHRLDELFRDELDPNAIEGMMAAMLGLPPSFRAWTVTTARGGTF